MAALRGGLVPFLQEHQPIVQASVQKSSFWGDRHPVNIPFPLQNHRPTALRVRSARLRIRPTADGGSWMAKSGKVIYTIAQVLGKKA